MSWKRSSQNIFKGFAQFVGVNVTGVHTHTPCWSECDGGELEVVCKDTTNLMGSGTYVSWSHKRKDTRKNCDKGHMFFKVWNSRERISAYEN